MPDTVTEERINRDSKWGQSVPCTVTEERVVYLISKQREVRCRLWFQVTPFRDGLRRFFLVGMEELD